MFFNVLNLSLTLHPDKVQVATGQVGKAPQILVWNSVSSKLETTSILKGGHTDGIGIIAFDKSGEVCFLIRFYDHFIKK